MSSIATILTATSRQNHTSDTAIIGRGHLTPDRAHFALFCGIIYSFLHHHLPPCWNSMCSVKKQARRTDQRDYYALWSACAKILRSIGSATVLDLWRLYQRLIVEWSVENWCLPVGVTPHNIICSTYPFCKTYTHTHTHTHTHTPTHTPTHTHTHTHTRTHTHTPHI